MPDWINFFERPFPSANTVLVRGKQAVLVDSGFGSDLAATEQWLRQVDMSPPELSLVLNTHYHSDHVGGNFGLQQRYGLPIAAHRWEASMVNSRNYEVGSANYLDQPIEPYQVDRLLAEGDEIDTGDVTLQVIHTPGHTSGHICLYHTGAGVLICGDVLQSNDVGWINIFREGVSALQQAMDSISKLQKLPLRQIIPGHGPVINNPAEALENVMRRYEKWLTEPQKMAWHGCKRIFAYKLMIRNGLNELDVRPFLLGCSWFVDYSRYFFTAYPPDFVETFVAEMVRSGAAGWQNKRLVALTSHNPPPDDWLRGPARPQDWPRL